MTFRQKLMTLAVAPLIVVTIAVTMFLTWQSTRLAKSNIEAFQQSMLSSKQAEIENLTNVALSSINSIYSNAAPDDVEAKARVSEILMSLDYGKDGYFFVYDFDGNSVVHPRQLFRNGKNWMSLVDPDGDRVISELIKTARAGGGYHRYKWQQPSTGALSDKISYVVALPKWNWILGTGAYLDDVAAQARAANLAIQDRTRQSFVLVALFALPAVFIVFATCIFVTFDQRKLANAVQKQLTQRVIETQERERSRLARELHDGISQELLGVRYAMELAGRRAGDVSPELNRAIEETISTLNTTIREIRNISHDLRPRALDDIGLVAAIKNLSEKFSARSGVAISLDADGFVDDLVPDARTALFRVTQEALSNVERHAGASRVSLRLWNERGRTRMHISDDGRGVDFSRAPQARGLGMENMRERIGHFGGVLLIDGDANGTRLLLMLPRSASQPVADSGAAA